MDEEINLINNIIAQAIMHGADEGGSYDSNEYHLHIAIEKWLHSKGLEREYTVRRVNRNDYLFCAMPQIVRKEKNTVCDLV